MADPLMGSLPSILFQASPPFCGEAFDFYKLSFLSAPPTSQASLFFPETQALGREPTQSALLLAHVWR